MWKCLSCGEQVEDNLDVCWSCQTPKDGSSSENYFSTKIPKGLEALKERMSKQSNEDLLRIVNFDSKDYREDALELARLELERRGLPQPSRLTRQSASEVYANSSNGMWKCGNCGKDNRDNRSHCWSCAMLKGVSNAEDSPVSRRVKTHSLADRPSICSKCSAPLDEDAKFCPSCAAPVLLHTMFNCPKCGKAISAGAKFCKYCAADITKREESSFAPRANYSHQDSFRNPQRNKADKLALTGGITAGVSALAFFWGYSYTSSFANTARAGLMNFAGQTDSTYTLAQFCITFGAIGFVIGLVLLIVGLAQR